MKRNLIWAVIGGLLVLAGLIAYRFFVKAQSTPILIGDGSIVIESEVPLVPNQYTQIAPNVLRHKDASKTMHQIMQNGNPKLNCGGHRKCKITAKWDNGFAIEIQESASQGVTITANGTGLDFNHGWEKHRYTWIYRLDSNVKLVDIEGTPDGSPTGPPLTPLCSGPGCTIEMEHYK
jgi:hypothetical protein